MNKDYLNRSDLLKILGILTFAIGFHWYLQQYELVADFLISLMHLLAPLLMGAAIAFLLNLPMRLIEHLIFRKPNAQSQTVLLDRYDKKEPDPVDETLDNLDKQKKQPQAKPQNQSGKRMSKLKQIFSRTSLGKVRDAISRPVSLILAIVFVFGIIVAVMVIVVPEMIKSIQALADKFPDFLDSAHKWVQDQTTVFPQLERFISLSEFNWQQIQEVVGEWLETGGSRIFESTFSFATAVFGGVFNVILGIIFAIYILFQKEKLGCQARLLLKAFVPDQSAKAFERIATLTNQTFNNFIVGQFIEANILGLLFLATLSIFGFPYPVLISVLLAFTALIPLIGSFIGATISALFILIASPNQVIWFLLLFIVLQQIEGDFIYPRVVGNSIGLPAIWVLMAVLIGGKLMGVMGILLFIPIFSILYVLLREYIYTRIKRIAETHKQPVD